MTNFLKKDKRIDISNREYLEAFNKLKLLIVSDPILVYPDFAKKFTLTTDASNFAIGAVLSQGNHPVCYASRTLNEHETKYSTIEKELLAIVWATKYFRPYLYGRKFTIQTDHKPLQWLHNLKEPNSKLQRWKAKLEEFNFDIEYLSGKENKVADALSRVEIHANHVDDDIGSVNATTHSAEEDNTEYIPISESPLNFYKTQIIVRKGSPEKIKIDKIVDRTRKTITIPNFDEQAIIQIFRNQIPCKGIVGIMIDDINNYNLFQNTYIKHFSKNKLLKLNKCSFILEDIKTKFELFEVILKQHEKLNHRGINNTYAELQNKIYFPKLKLEIQKVINNCHICNTAKYERHPLKLPFKITETPSKPLEVVHMDIWFKSKGNPYLTLIDKFTKHVQVIPIQSRNWSDLKNALMQYIGSLGKPKNITTDQEKGFNISNFLNFLNAEGITVHFTTPNNHSSNGDIERFHSTLNEHLRILNAIEKEQEIQVDGDFVIKSVKVYNETIHTSTGKRPVDFLNGTISPDEYPKIHKFLEEQKAKRINCQNKRRQNGKPSDYLKLNRVNKLQPHHKKVTIQETDDDHFKVNKEKLPRYIRQFKRKFQFQN